ncbi:unnamed protein product [Closterium sp. NIES-65]|nr:unnamed protein product [Closterium sp. NIES-65]
MRAGALVALVALAALLILSDITGLGPARMLRKAPPRRPARMRMPQGAEVKLAQNWAELAQGESAQRRGYADATGSGGRGWAWGSGTGGVWGWAWGWGKGRVKWGGDGASGRAEAGWIGGPGGGDWECTFAEGGESGSEGGDGGESAEADREINGWTLSSLEAFAKENGDNVTLTNGDPNTWSDERARELEAKYYNGKKIPFWREYSGEGDKRSGGMVIGLNEKGRQIWGLAQLRVTAANVTIKYERLGGGQGGGGGEGEGGGPGQEGRELREVGVRFRGATWRPAVGQWLKAYANPLPAVAVESRWFSEPCRNDCSGRGVCNHERGTCQCPIGYKGPDCSLLSPLLCNMPASPNAPLGVWVVSSCPRGGLCDTTTARCLCGNATAYPTRPLFGPCGFNTGKGDWFLHPNISKVRLTSPSAMGWCQIDPAQAASGQQKLEGGSHSLCACPASLGGTALTAACHPRPQQQLWHSHVPFLAHICPLSPSPPSPLPPILQCEPGWYGIDCSRPSQTTAAALALTLSSIGAAGGSKSGGISSDLHGEGHGVLQREHEGQSGQAGQVVQAEKAQHASLPLPEWFGASAADGETWEEVELEGSEEEQREEEVGGAGKPGSNAVVSAATMASVSSASMSLLAPRRRPLIYIYDLPAELSSHPFQGRHSRFYCTPWLYGFQNETDFNHGWLYGLEGVLFEGLLASVHRTNDPWLADYFYVPLPGACMTARADDSPAYSMLGKYLVRRTNLVADFYLQAYHHIRSHYPFWNRTGGRDHIWVSAVWGGGAEGGGIGNSMLCYAHSTTLPSLSPFSFPPVPCLPSPVSPPPYPHPHLPSSILPPSSLPLLSPAALCMGRGGTHPCYDPHKDVVMPAFKGPRMDFYRRRLWKRPLSDRPLLFYFNGQLGAAFGGRPEKDYSMGIRQRVAHLFASIENVNGSKGELWAPDVVVTSKRSEDYSFNLSSSRFCGVFPGDGFSARMEDAMLHGCIPVIVQDGIHLPFENFLSYEDFTVRIAEEDISSMISILRSLPTPRVQHLWAGVQRMWQRWVYHGVMRLEAKRQREQHGHHMAWAEALEEWIEEDRGREEDRVGGAGEEREGMGGVGGGGRGGEEGWRRGRGDSVVGVQEGSWVGMEGGVDSVGPRGGVGGRMRKRRRSDDAFDTLMQVRACVQWSDCMQVCVCRGMAAR